STMPSAKYSCSGSPDMLERSPHEAALQPQRVDVHRRIGNAIGYKLARNIIRWCHARGHGVSATVDDRLGLPLARLVRAPRRLDRALMDNDRHCSPLLRRTPSTTSAARRARSSGSHVNMFVGHSKIADVPLRRPASGTHSGRSVSPIGTTL